LTKPSWVIVCDFEHGRSAQRFPHRDALRLEIGIRREGSDDIAASAAGRAGLDAVIEH
jgi:hypothetical protein